jgi:hypothetical protein
MQLAVPTLAFVLPLLGCLWYLAFTSRRMTEPQLRRTAGLMILGTSAYALILGRLYPAAVPVHWHFVTLLIFVGAWGFLPTSSDERPTDTEQGA